jgi:hypothetical protein
MWSLGAWGRRGRSDSGKELAGGGRGRGGAGLGRHMRPTCGSSWGRDTTDKGAPRLGDSLAAAVECAGGVAV